jgi:hypothetical protein
MIAIEYAGRMGNQLFQHAYARLLASRLGFQLNAAPINGFPATEAPFAGTTVAHPLRVYENLQRLNFETVERDLARAGPCGVLLRRCFLEHYPTLRPYSAQIRSWYSLPPCDDPGALDLRILRQGQFEAASISAINPSDVLIILRLGDFLKPKHTHRLLLADYFSALLDCLNLGRVFIISDSIDSPEARAFIKLDPVYLFQRDYFESFRFALRFKRICLSQSTFAWWCAYLSSADEVYFPITRDGPWSYARMSSLGHDLRVPEGRYIYVDVAKRSIIGGYGKTSRALEIA